jgi:hypothetical protein
MTIQKTQSATQRAQQRNNTTGVFSYVPSTLRLQQTFSNSTTWTVPAGVRGVYALIVGGGGGGSAMASNGLSGSAGSVTLIPVPVNPGATVGITIGGGGLGATSGNVTGGTGGSTSLTTLGLTYSSTGGNGAFRGDGSSGSMITSVTSVPTGITGTSISFNIPTVSTSVFPVVTAFGYGSPSNGPNLSGNSNFAWNWRLGNAQGMSQNNFAQTSSVQSFSNGFTGAGGHGIRTAAVNANQQGEYTSTFVAPGGVFPGGLRNGATVGGGGGGVLGPGVNVSSGSAAAGNGGNGGGGGGGAFTGQSKTGGAGGAGCVLLYY